MCAKGDDMADGTFDRDLGEESREVDIVDERVVALV